MSNCNLSLPNIFVIGLHGKKGKNLIDGIIDNPIINSDFPDNYPWFIDNKYYTSSVNFYDVQDYKEISSAAINTVEAILIYIDPNQKSVLEEVEIVLLTLAEKCDTDKQILIVDKFEDIEGDQHLKGNTKLEYLHWCINHGFELVDLSSCDDEYEENENNEESPSRSSIGMFTIKQSLHAHCWSNLILKDKAVHNDFTLSQAENIIHDTNADENKIFPEVENLNRCEEAEVDSFSALLASLGDMKIKADSLSNDERKIFAEKVAISFWQSFGGDEEEIRFSNSDSE